MAKYTPSTEYYIMISQRGNSINIIYSLMIIRQWNDFSNAAVHIVQLHRMKRNKMLLNYPKKFNEYYYIKYNNLTFYIFLYFNYWKTYEIKIYLRYFPIEICICFNF